MRFLLILITFLAAPMTQAQLLRTIQLDDRPAEVNFAVGAGNLDQPLIIALHGATGNSIQFQIQSDIVGRATRANIRLALLNGQQHGRTYYGAVRSWNAGDCCYGRTGDDIAYLASVIEQLQTGSTGNGRKVILLGHSNGAMMSYALMCARPDLVDGVVGVAGTLAISSCTRPSNTRVVHIHGTMDETVPLEGDLDLSDGRNFGSLAEMQAAFNAAGINDTTILVEGASHGIQDIDRKLRAQESFSIAEVALALTAP